MAQWETDVESFDMLTPLPVIGYVRAERLWFMDIFIESIDSFCRHLLLRCEIKKLYERSHGLS